MGKRRLCTDTVQRSFQGFGDVADNHMVFVRDAVRVRGDALVKDENLAVGEQLTQVIEGAAVAEAEFQDRTGHVDNHVFRHVEAVALCGDAADKGIESAHLYRSVPYCL